MSTIVDRRLNGKNKSTVNRHRFLDRYSRTNKEAMKRAIDRALGGDRSIKDEGSVDISIPKRGISEPVFRHGRGGKREMVHPGNKEYYAGDKIERPNGGGGGGAGEGDASKDGEGNDDFVFTLSFDEYLDFLFADLELPNMVKQNLQGATSFKWNRAGYSNDGSDSKRDNVKTKIKALARRKAVGAQYLNALQDEEEQVREILGRYPSLITLTPTELEKYQQQSDHYKSRYGLPKDTPKKREERVKALCNAWQNIQAQPEQLEQIAPHDREKLTSLFAEASENLGHYKKIPSFDPIDERYKLHVKTPKPHSKAAMMCLMDVSGSMNQEMKESAKRFYLLLYLFLKRNYNQIDVRFLAHHSQAWEATEEEFFRGTSTGGTDVTEGHLLMSKVMDEYNIDEWNLYGAQCSDGDSWGNEDNASSLQLLREKIMPRMQYYTYSETRPRGQGSLWSTYKILENEMPDKFAMANISSPKDVTRVFRGFFKARNKAAGIENMAAYGSNYQPSLGFKDVMAWAEQDGYGAETTAFTQEYDRQFEAAQAQAQMPYDQPDVGIA